MTYLKNYRLHPTHWLISTQVPYLYDDSDLRPEQAAGLEALEAAIRLHVRTTYGHAAARALRADGIYFHRQHALYSEPDRAWTHVAVRHSHFTVPRPPRHRRDGVFPTHL